MTLSPRNQDVLTEFKQGSYFAVSALYDEHYFLLTDFARQLIVQETEAHFIVQETLIKLFLMRDRFNTMADIKAFLYITVRNTCFAYTRAEQMEATAAEASWLEQALHTNARFDDEAVRLAALCQLQQQVMELPGPEQTVFRAIFCDRLTMPAAAEQLGLSPMMVSQHRINAIRLLRERLAAAELFAIPLFIYFVAVYCRHTSW